MVMARLVVRGKAILISLYYGIKESVVEEVHRLFTMTKGSGKCTWSTENKIIQSAENRL